jgi:hypothetical protein
VRYWVNILPEVVRGVQSFGFTNPSSDDILQFVETYLAAHGERCAVDRWHQCPDDFFVYSHHFVEGGRYHSLEFLVRDTAAVVGVLEVVWVEHHPGNLV